MRKLANARWFGVMKCFYSLLASHDGLLLESGRNLCLFLSRHALLLHKHEDLGHTIYWRISSLLDYARAVAKPSREGSCYNCDSFPRGRIRPAKWTAWNQHGRRTPNE